MQRIKIPYGGLTAAQLEVLAELAEEYSDGIAHITTRQDFQLHYVHLEDTPAIMRRLAAVGITTREACGNTVRNVTACPLTGVCQSEVFDVTPYARALAYFMLGHPDAQAFGRKFKISFSGCATESCALARMHDFGAIAVKREINGRTRRGFELWVGGGLGAVPQQARLFTDFLPEEELLPTAQAIGRVFARLGEKKNRNTARMKFLVTKLGIEEFRRIVAEERAMLAPDPRWTAFLADIERPEESGLKPPSLMQIEGARPEGLRPVEDGQHLCAAAAGLLRGDDRAAPGRHRGRAVAPARRYRTQLRGGHDTHDGGAEHRAAMGGRAGPAGPIRRSADRGTRIAHGRAHQRHRFVPRDGHLQAGNRLFARPRGRTAAAARSARR
jgi:sulfite reductase beta subunit-like hemoprotein